MRAVLIILSVMWIALGTMVVLYTDAVRKSIKGLIVDVNIRLLGILPLAGGFLLVVGGFMVKEVFWIAVILGLLAITKGAFLLRGPIPMIQQLTDWWFDSASETTVRLSGLIVFMLGVTLLTWLL
jgi:hypothetical protein